MDDYPGSGSHHQREEDSRIASPLPVLDPRHLVMSLEDLYRRVRLRRLTDGQRVEIRARALFGVVRIRALAREYGVSREAIARTLGRRK